MAIDVRSVLKNKLPYTLPPSTTPKSSSSLKPHVEWGQFDPERQARHPVKSKSENLSTAAFEDIAASLTPPLSIDDFNQPWDNYRDEVPPIEARDIDFDDLLRPPPVDRGPRTQGNGGWGEEDNGTGRVVESCAFYKPFHFHDDWGIHIKEGCMLNLQKEIAQILARWCKYHCRVSSAVS